MTTKTMSPLVEQQFKTSAGVRREVLIDNMLTESEGVTVLNVLAEGKDNGTLIVEGKVGMCGIPTANKRLYERRLMEREVKRLQEKIERRAAFAAVDHPGDGKSRLRDAGAICIGLKVEASGAVWAKYEIVEESSGGKDLAAFLRRGCAIGMSSRGLGSTRMSAEGHHVVGEDFKLHGFDFVADPACRDAYPTLVSEDIDPDTVSENELRVRFPSLVESIETRARQTGVEVAQEDAYEIVRSEVEEQYKEALSEASEALREDIKLEVYAECREALRDDFAAKLLTSIQSAKTEALEIARSELLSDPKVAGAKRFVAEMAERLVPYHPDPQRQSLMDQKDSEIAQLRVAIAEQSTSVESVSSRVEEAESKARSFGKQLYVERALRGFDEIDEMFNMVGDVNRFDSVEELQEHVRSVIRQVNEAELRATEKVQETARISEHKVDLANTKASRLNEQLDRVRTEFADRIEGVVESLNGRIQEKDEILSEDAGEIDRLKAELQAQQRQSDNAIRLQQEAELSAYAVRRAQGHPRRDDIMAAVQNGRVTTKEGVRQLAESLDCRGEEPGGASERIRRSLGRGHEAPSEGARVRNQQLTEQQSVPGFENVSGSSMSELRRLAGIGNESQHRRF